MSGPRVFIVESLYPKDFYKGRLDGQAARDVLKIENSQVQYRIAFDKEHLEKAVNEAAHNHRFDVFHLSCHGDDDGIDLTDGTSIEWLKLAEILNAFSGPDKILVMSSCNGGNVGLTKALEKQGALFGWVFGAKDEVGFTDSCLAWSVLYRRLGEVKKNGCSKKTAKQAIDLINPLVDGRFVYRRWDNALKKYLTYPAFAT